MHRYLDKRARWLVPVCAFGLVIPIISAALAGSAGTLVWLIDLASHWQWLYLAGLVLGCAIAVLKDRRWAFWLLAVPLPWLTASSPAPNAGNEKIPNAKVLAVASANVPLENHDTAALVRWLAAAKPDVLVLHEVSPGYAKGLGALDAYPFRHLMPRQDPFGMAVLSRFPLGEIQTVEDEDGIRHIDALLDWNGQPVRLTAFHPMPPISQHDHSVRNQKLQGLAKAAKASEHPAIVAGDLNATPWSNAFSKLNQAGLRRASGLAPTWPAVGRGWMGIPIDHVLVTQQWSVVEQQVGPKLGSDHLPVIVRIAISADEKRKP
ncbi:MAG: endonuclease/exonuclease/phosphatase family protein [Thiobacillus sp.]